MTLELVVGNKGFLINKHSSTTEITGLHKEPIAYEYVGISGRGQHVKHMFRACRGGWLICVNPVDFALGDVSFRDLDYVPPKLQRRNNGKTCRHTPWSVK